MNVENKNVTYTSELKAEVDRRLAAYENGTEKAVTAAESKKRINKLLKGSKKHQK